MMAESHKYPGLSDIIRARGGSLSYRWHLSGPLRIGQIVPIWILGCSKRIGEGRYGRYRCLRSKLVTISAGLNLCIVVTHVGASWDPWTNPLCRSTARRTEK
jgi:hypothetical protein